ncbi:MAG: hypothetical protein L6R39_001236 [Caloplaca ligustica]|nr:MAG: hypothetical protein L6R39_001236 [Caloplaca ligustica]
MAATRQIHIYEDPSFDPSPSERVDFVHPMLDSSLPPSDGRSPLKRGHANTMPSKVSFNDLEHVPLPRPIDAAFKTDSPMKQPQSAWCYPVAPPVADTAVFGSLSAFASYDQENHHQLPHSDNCAAFPDFASASKSLKPRQTHVNPGPLKAGRGKPTGLDAPTQAQLPAPHEFPPPEDTGKKPQLSYAQLIGMAILRSPERRLTLAQIYKWISDSFAFYRLSSTPTGWQNSIRHNLSISDAFTKQERRKDDPGKGNYWIIVPGKEGKFLKQKSGRRPQSAGGPAMKIFAQPLNEPSSSAWSVAPSAVQKPVVHLSEVPEQPSSDATIPASDAFSPEDRRHQEAINMPPPASRLSFSPPSPVIASSPPLDHAELIRGESPLLASDPLLPLTHKQDRKRTSTAMDDSGYFSSLESSTARQYSTAKGLNNLELEQPRLKRGRAEEEIARIRSSSHDTSPSKTRSLAKQATPQLVSSSPSHELDSSIMLGPLTPGLTFKRPQRPPASVSPNTNLRDHRKRTEALLGSPMRDMGVPHGGTSFSPTFNIPDDDYYGLNDGPHSSFEIFTDASALFDSRRVFPSPEERCVRPKRPARPGKLSSALADVSGASLNRKTPTSIFKSSYLDSPIRPHKSAVKIRDFEGDENATLGKGEQEEFFNFDIFADEDEEQDDFGGLDLLQGFQRIGRNDKATPKAKKVTRPALGARSHTSRF